MVEEYLTGDGRSREQNASMLDGTNEEGRYETEEGVLLADGGTEQTYEPGLHDYVYPAVHACAGISFSVGGLMQGNDTAIAGGSIMIFQAYDRFTQMRQDEEIDL